MWVESNGHCTRRKSDIAIGGGSVAGFRINYGQVVGQANEISNLANDLNREVQKLESILSTIQSGWKGPASTAYQNHLNLLIADMRQTGGSMSSVASTIKSVAWQIQQEDERQAELAKQLAASTKDAK